jgi:hypothetical protein
MKGQRGWRDGSGRYSRGVLLAHLGDVGDHVFAELEWIRERDVQVVCDQRAGRLRTEAGAYTGRRLASSRYDSQFQEVRSAPDQGHVHAILLGNWMQIRNTATGG